MPNKSKHALRINPFFVFAASPKINIFMQNQKGETL